MALIALAAPLLLAGTAEARSGCRPASSTPFDRDPAGGTVYVTGKAPARTLVACRTRTSRAAVVMRESTTHRLLRARAGRDLAVIISRDRGRQRITARSFGGTTRFWVRARSIAGERLAGTRVVWLEDTRTLRLFRGDDIVTLDTGSRLRGARFAAGRVVWRHGGGEFTRHFGRDPCRPKGSQRGIETAAIKTFSVSGPNPDSEEPAQLLFACDPARARSVFLFRAAGEGLGGASVKPTAIAGHHVLFTASGGNQYASWSSIGIGDVLRGTREGIHSDSSMIGGPYSGASPVLLDAGGAVALFTVVTDGAGKTQTTSLLLHDAEGNRTLDTGAGLADLALDGDTVRWTKDGVAKSAAIRR